MRSALGFSASSRAAWDAREEFSEPSKATRILLNIDFEEVGVD